MSKVIRWVLTAALCYGVWTETGLWTTVFTVFVALANEASAAAIRRVRRG